jgi:hypothetical protein
MLDCLNAPQGRMLDYYPVFFSKDYRPPEDEVIDPEIPTIDHRGCTSLRTAGGRRPAGHDKTWTDGGGHIEFITPDTALAS